MSVPFFNDAASSNVSSRACARKESRMVLKNGKKHRDTKAGISSMERSIEKSHDMLVICTPSTYSYSPLKGPCISTTSAPSFPDFQIDNLPLPPFYYILLRPVRVISTPGVQIIPQDASILTINTMTRNISIFYVGRYQ